MVKIVTGKINSLKTTRLLNHYQESLKGDGFIAEKIMKDNLVFGYDLVRLSDKFRVPYVRRNIYLEEGKEVIYQVGPYCFYEDAFKVIESSVRSFIVNRTSPVYLDEISLLELEDKGLHKVLVDLLESKVDLVLVVRSDILDLVVEKYGLTDVILVE